MIPDNSLQTSAMGFMGNTRTEFGPVAIIGMAGRFPRASNIEEFWGRICAQEDCVTRFTSEELRDQGVSEDVYLKPNYVAAAPVLSDIDFFDPGFFGITPREADLMDPQQRLFLETCWEALEDAGYDPQGIGNVGLFAGARTDTYLLNILSQPGLLDAVGTFHLGLGNDLAFLTSRVSHLLNLHGPSISLHTACSTSLVAVHLACKSLQEHECDAALAGGVAINVPHRVGYMYEEGSVQSPDGTCRVFDSSARGTVFGSGVGVVVLKRLSDAIRDHDSITALIIGSAINNDGADKASFTAPSVRGQVEVIRAALRAANSPSESIGYVECHGTGTLLGDAIEVRALSKAFGKGPSATCALGSVKSNVGHLDAAAGITGLIKSALCLKHKILPASRNYVAPNPQIRFDGTRFFVNTRTRPWETDFGPLRAGVSAFGVGGTNAHLILQEPPRQDLEEPERSPYILPLSARSASALTRSCERLADHLDGQPDLNLADVAFTLQEGRHHFSDRKAFLCQNPRDAIQQLREARLTSSYSRGASPFTPASSFLFPGQGVQYPAMARNIYDSEAVFRSELRNCAEILEPAINRNLLDLLYGKQPASSEELSQTWLAQPALLAVEYALAKVWMSWGLQPESLAGHSLGEYTAAVLAGIFSLEDGLRLVAARGHLMQNTPSGAMLAVSEDANAIAQWLDDDLSIIAINAPGLCTIGGPTEAVFQLETTLRIADIGCQSLRTSHAFHCNLVDSALEPYRAELMKISIGVPDIPILSGVTGTWLKTEEAQDPEYWLKQMRQPVQFSPVLTELMMDGRILIDVGPGQTLRRLALKHRKIAENCIVLPAMPAMPGSEEREAMLSALAQLWEAGIEVTWSALHSGNVRRISLPGYPFERTRHWISPVTAPLDVSPSMNRAKELVRFKDPEVSHWLWTPSWHRLPLAPSSQAPQQWVVVSRGEALSAQLSEELGAAGHTVIRVHLGQHYAENGPLSFDVDADLKQDFERVFSTISGTSPLGAHLVIVEPREVEREHKLDRTGKNPPWVLASELFCVQAALRSHAIHPFKLRFVTCNLAQIERYDLLDEDRSGILAFAKTLEDEYPYIDAGVIDVAFGASEESERTPVDYLASELLIDKRESFVAYRGRKRWVQRFERLIWHQDDYAPRQPNDETYIVFGGFGTVGSRIAKHLATYERANLVLVSRTTIPERTRWPEILRDGVPSKLARCIGTVLELEKLGARVETHAADIRIPAEIAQAIIYCEAKFGHPRGIIHAAGVTSGPSAFCPWPNLEPSLFRVQEDAKLLGTKALVEALQGRRIPLVLLVSSNSSIVGGFGFAAYGSSSCVMNSIAEWMRSRASGTQWLSVSWDHWPEERQTETSSQLEDLYGGVDERVLVKALEMKHRYAMTEDEVTRALALVFSCPIDGHLIVSTGDLNARLTPETQPSEFVTATQTRAPLTSQVRTERPILRNVYVAPTTDVEASVASLWEDFLGLERVGLHDDFFELGGHSLLATQLVAEIRTRFQVALPLAKLFEGPTVFHMAQTITGLRESIELPTGSAELL